MKIAYILEVFPSLSQTFVLNQITGLLDRGHEVDIYAEYTGDSHKVHADVEKYNLQKITYYQPQTPTGKLERVGQGFYWFWRYFFRAPFLMLRSVNFFRYGKSATSLRLLYAVIPFVRRRPKYDIIMCHFGLLGLKGMALRDLGAISGKLVTAFHGVDMSQNLEMLGRHLYAPLFKAGEGFLPISGYWKNRLIELGCNPSQIAIHPMGIDTKKFVFQPREREFQGATRLISVSRLTEKKGIEYGIQAVAALLEQGLLVEYLVIGDGERRASLAALVTQLGVGHAVKLLGPRDHTEVLAELSRAHILLAPSVTAQDGNQEGIPVALMEAMAMGMPVVSTYHSGIPELVDDGESGFLVPERDTGALVAVLTGLVQRPETWLALGAAGRQKIENEYAIDKLNTRLVSLFKQVLSLDKRYGLTTSPLGDNATDNLAPYSAPTQL
ncbi:MAG: glycosyltransferase [Nodosilinea sp.]